MKKLTAILLAVIMCLGLLSGCSGDDSKTGSSGGEATVSQDAPAEAASYDVGKFTVSVPAGWKEFPQKDIWADEDDAVDESKIVVVKGGETELDELTKPCVRISYYNPGSHWGDFDSTLAMYDDVEKLGQTTIGERTYDYAKATSFDTPYIILLDSDEQVEIYVMLEAVGGKIAFEDADVQAIIESIKVK